MIEAYFCHATFLLALYYETSTVRWDERDISGMSLQTGAKEHINAVLLMESFGHN